MTCARADAQQAREHALPSRTCTVHKQRARLLMLDGWPVELVPGPVPSAPFAFILQLGDEVDGISPERFLPHEESEVPGFSRFTLTLHRPERTHLDELRQYKALCDRLLPGTRYGSHLYTLVHLDLTTFSVTLSEYGEVIGGTTIRFIRATAEPILILE
eukprot:5157097-Prymnesium_polylepis.2